MLREKATMTAPKKENVVVDMVLAITTHTQIFENVVFKEKESFKNKRLANWQEKEKLQHLFEEAIKDIQKKEPPKDLHGANIQIRVKANFIKNFDLDTRPTRST